MKPNKTLHLNAASGPFGQTRIGTSLAAAGERWRSGDASRNPNGPAAIAR